MRGRTTCASGSPSRQLNSMTFRPSRVSISPAYRIPTYGHPSAASAATTGSMISVRALRSTSWFQRTPRGGLYAPIPPVLGPVSPSPTRL